MISTDELQLKLPTTLGEFEPEEEIMIVTELNEFGSSSDYEPYGSRLSTSPSLSYDGSLEMQEDPNFASVQNSKVYATLEPATKPRLDEMNIFKYTKDGPSYIQNVQRLRSIPPSEWNETDVMNFLVFLARKQSFDLFSLGLEAFKNVSGSKLLSMTKEEMLKRDKVYGGQIFDVVHEMALNASTRSLQTEHMIPEAFIKRENTYDGYSSSSGSDHGYGEECSGARQQGLPGIASFVRQNVNNYGQCYDSEMQNSAYVEISNHVYEIDNNPSQFPWIHPQATERLYMRNNPSPNSMDSGCESGDTSPRSYGSVGSVGSVGSSYPYDSMFPYDNNYENVCYDRQEIKQESGQKQYQNKKYNNPQDLTEKKPCNRGRKPGGKGNHLWEFIRDLLLDDSYNEKVIKWVNKEDGIFKIVQSSAVAKLWGRKKNNSGMNYEKLSRALRYYYERDILERVDGKRLVYKFGKQSNGWKKKGQLK